MKNETTITMGNNFKWTNFLENWHQNWLGCVMTDQFKWLLLIRCIWGIEWLFHWTINFKLSCIRKGKRHELCGRSMARKWILIFQLQLTPENWKLFALEMESLTSEVKLKEKVVASLHFFGKKCTALIDWMSENTRTWRKGICSSWINESSPILFPWRK